MFESENYKLQICHRVTLLILISQISVFSLLDIVLFINGICAWLPKVLLNVFEKLSSDVSL